MYDRSIVMRTFEARDRTQELVSKSQSLCRESEWLITATKDVIGDLDDFLAHFTDHAADA